MMSPLHTCLCIWMDPHRNHGRKMGDTHGLATFVFIKKDDTWFVTAVENVVV